MDHTGRNAPETRGNRAGTVLATGMTTEPAETTRITFRGVRGSCPAPGPSTPAEGGNTSCVEVQCGGTTLILDAGTGIRPLGQELLRSGRRNLVLLDCSEVRRDLTFTLAARALQRHQLRCTASHVVAL